jgi:ABC-type branched-subunit amino acid transport system substrate-binding protein
VVPQQNRGTTTNRSKPMPMKTMTPPIHLRPGRGPTAGSKLLLGLLTAAASFATGLQAEGPPTAQVNTTGLAVTDTTVTVGQLHSATGTMAISETGSIQAEQLAIDQINPNSEIEMSSFSQKEFG